MIIAIYNENPIEIIDALNRQVLIKTLDGSKPFTARVTRSDPEELPLPEFVNVDWQWVNRNQLAHISQTSLSKVDILKCVFIYPESLQCVRIALCEPQTNL
jgi:hypothetical protein